MSQRAGYGAASFLQLRTYAFDMRAKIGVAVGYLALVIVVAATPTLPSTFMSSADHICFVSDFGGSR